MVEAGTVVVEVELFVRWSAARTDEGDKGAGRGSVTVFDTDRIPCSPSTRARNVAIAHPPTRRPLRRIPSSMLDNELSQNKYVLNHG